MFLLTPSKSAEISNYFFSKRIKKYEPRKWRFIAVGGRKRGRKKDITLMSAVDMSWWRVRNLLLETYVTTFFHINHSLWHAQERDCMVSSLFHSDFLSEKALSLLELHFCVP